MPLIYLRDEDGSQSPEFACSTKDYQVAETLEAVLCKNAIEMAFADRLYP